MEDMGVTGWIGLIASILTIHEFLVKYIGKKAGKTEKPCKKRRKRRKRRR